MRLWLPLFLVSLLLVKTSRASDTNEALIEVHLIYDQFTTAILSSETAWCSPATLVGPRVFVTAAHCVHLIPDNQMLSVVGPSFRENRHVRAIHMMGDEIATDERFFDGESCKRLFEGIQNNAILTLPQLLTCWNNDGSPDLALIEMEDSIPGKMFTLSSSDSSIGENFRFFRNTDRCANDKGAPSFSLSTMPLFGFKNSQMIFDARGLTGTNGCKFGGSGGTYFSLLKNETIQISAIHSGSTKDGVTMDIHGKRVTVPGNVYGGTRVGSTTVQSWLKSTASKEEFSICGVNRKCPEIIFPGVHHVSVEQTGSFAVCQDSCRLRK